MTTTNPPFMSLPVTGHIAHGRTMADQKPMEELTPLFQALLDDATILAFGWRQYTPYFNDGETCVFDTHGFWVKTNDPETLEKMEEDGYDYDEEDEELFDVLYGSHPTLGERKSVWNRERNEYDEQPYVGPDEARYDRVMAAARAVEGGAFDTALLKQFGDHATIKITREGVEVGSYEHD